MRSGRALCRHQSVPFLNLPTPRTAAAHAWPYCKLQSNFDQWRRRCSQHVAVRTRRPAAPRTLLTGPRQAQAATMQRCLGHAKLPYRVHPVPRPPPSTQSSTSSSTACLHQGGRQRLLPCQAATASTQGPPTTIVRISPERLAAGGVDPAQEPAANKAGFADMLRSGFMPVNIDHAGLRIMNIDPPVLTIDDFLPAATCDALVAAAGATGGMAQSKVGGAGDVPTDMRTSSTLAITQSALKQHPALQQPLEQLLSAAARLVVLGTDSQQLMARLCTPPSSPSQICPELPQVARYQPGQHFLAHEDGFPAQIALKKGYQRRATLLVYLNDVAEGGATRFEHLGLAVQPRKGKALLFFPAFSGGMPDARTLHTATDAVNEKWVSQLWLVSALPQLPPRAAGGGAGVRAQPVGSNSSSKTSSKTKRVKRKK